MTGVIKKNKGTKLKESSAVKKRTNTEGTLLDYKNSILSIAFVIPAIVFLVDAVFGTLFVTYNLWLSIIGIVSISYIVLSVYFTFTYQQLYRNKPKRRLIILYTVQFILFNYFLASLHFILNAIFDKANFTIYYLIYFVFFMFFAMYFMSKIDLDETKDLKEGMWEVKRSFDTNLNLFFLMFLVSAFASYVDKTLIYSISSIIAVGYLFVLKVNLANYK